MSDPRRDRDATRNPDRGAPPRAPRWVKMSVIIVALLALALVAIMLLGEGDHGPSRHAAAVPPTLEMAPQATGWHGAWGHQAQPAW
jgi:hypothetical protein